MTGQANGAYEMVLDSRILLVKQHFGIYQLSDWSNIRPQDVVAIRDVGPATLDHIRLYLSAHNVTLKDDQTPDYWKKHLSDVKIGAQMSESDMAVTCPFTIVIDSQEKHPFTFTDLSADSDREHRPLIVPTIWRSLGTAMGDYSIDGYEDRCAIERKSLEDAHGTFLGWGERRARFEREIANLSQMECAAVVVESSFLEMVQRAPSRGKKSAQENAKILLRQVLAWQQDYRVPWVFCDGRRLAEIATFRILERFWRKNHEAAKVAINGRRSSTRAEDKSSATMQLSLSEI
jgi:DNA excision repair protein ERCC-4